MGRKKRRSPALRAHDRMLKKGENVSKKEYGPDGKSKTKGRSVHLPGMYNEHRDAGVKAAKPDMMSELKTLAAFSEQSGTELSGASKAKSSIKQTGANEDFMALMPETVQAKNTAMQDKVEPVLHDTFGKGGIGATKNEVKRTELDGTTYFDKSVQKQGMAGDESARELYIPLMSHALGLDTLALSGRGEDATGGSRIITEGAEGQSIGDRLKNGSVEDMDALAKVSGDDVLKTMLSQMLFQDKDGHSEQYLVSDEGGLTKIDQGEMGMEDDGGPDFTGTSDKTLAASSFMAAMPAAHDEITPEMYEVVKNWKPADFQAMQEASGMYAEDSEAIKRQVHNMEIIQALMEESKGRLTPNELFKAFNTQRLNEATDSDHEEHPAFQAYQDQDLEGGEDGQKTYSTESATYENMGRFGTERSFADDAWVESMGPRQGGYEALDAMAEMRKTRTESNRETEDQIAHEMKKWKKKGKSPFASKRRKRKLDEKYGARVQALLDKKL